jgi:FkbM family methyltransferase
MNILIYGTMIGPGGIAHHTREFTKRLAKLHNVKFRNFNVPNGWNGKYAVDMYVGYDNLDNIHHKILYEQTLWTVGGDLVEYPLTGYDPAFKPDVHLVMAEANHHYYYGEFDKINAPSIAYFPWETDRIRDDFFSELFKFTQLWVPSEWQKKILINQGYPGDRVVVVPEGVDSTIYYPTDGLSNNKKFTFLHIGTWEYRKSTYEICKTFIDEYGTNENVELRLSIHNKFRDQDDPISTFNKFDLTIPDNIVFLDTLNEFQYVDEIRNANVYLSCARGEGWNLPLIQSMASGIPSIWSNIGGQTEFAVGSELGCDNMYEFPVTTIRYINGEPWYWEWGQGFPGNLYEPDFSKFTEYIRSVYTNYEYYKQKAIEFSKNIHTNFDWWNSVNLASDIITKLKEDFLYIKPLLITNITDKHIYYKIHSISFGDTLASTPTVRYLSNVHGCKINIVTHNKSVFNNNPYIDNLFSFDEFDKINISNSDIIYESFTSAGKQDERGIEKKFGHIDIRQLHCMDLGFQLSPEHLSYDFYPDKLRLDIRLPDEYVVLHITNNWPNRTWDYNNWTELIQWLADKKVFTVLIGFGHRESVHHSISDIPLEKQCPSFDNLYGLDLANQGTMSDMWHIINNAKCLITMDTGPLHLAGTTDTHIIQLGSAIHPSFRSPYRNGSQNYKYIYIGGECSLFCNSNLTYNVREWGHVNAIPPQTGCLEGYSYFKCHPTANVVKDSISNIIKTDILQLVEVSWDGTLFRYNFSKSIDTGGYVVLRDLKTGFKIHSVSHQSIQSIDGGVYWLGIDTDVYVNTSVVLELYINGEMIDSKNIYRKDEVVYTVNDVPINTQLFNTFSDYENVFMTFYEVFIQKIYNKYNVTVEKDDIVLDIGANHGFFTLYAVNMGAEKVISVDPIDVCYSNLCKLSNIFQNIHALNYAVTDKTDYVEFAVNDNSTAGSFMMGVDYYPVDMNVRTINVPSININELLLENPTVNFLKVDCEGAEDIIFDVIDTELLLRIPKLIIESHTTLIKDKIESKLIDLGYMTVVEPGGVDGIYMMYCKKI